jgi:Flp pilus assembly protein TadG
MTMQKTFDRIRRLVRNERGTSLIEFSLLAPVFIFLLIGLVEVGRYTYYGIVAAHAARAAVHYGSVGLTTAADTAGMKTAAVADAPAVSGASWTVTPTHFCTVSGAPIVCPGDNGSVSPTLVYYVQVQVTGTIRSLLNYPGIPTNIPISATAVMRVQDQ